MFMYILQFVLLLITNLSNKSKFYFELDSFYYHSFLLFFLHVLFLESQTVNHFKPTTPLAGNFISFYR